MATLTTAIEVSLRGGGRGAQHSAPVHRWLVRWNEDGTYTLSHFPAQPASYELKSWAFAHQGELVEVAREQGWLTPQDEGWVPLNDTSG